MNQTGLEFDAILKESLDMQLKRIEDSYADFMSRDGFKELPDFFRKHLYAPEVRKQRVETIEKFRERTRISAGSKVSESLDNLINLAKVSDELDNMVALKVQGYIENGEEFNLKTLEKAMGEIGKAEIRREQIISLTEALDFFFSLTQMSFVKLLLSPIKIACNVFGAGFIADTIEEGYRVAKGIDDIAPFLAAFREREIEYWNRVLPGAPLEAITADN